MIFYITFFKRITTFIISKHSSNFCFMKFWEVSGSCKSRHFTMTFRKIINERFQSARHVIPVVYASMRTSTLTEYLLNALILIILRIFLCVPGEL